MLWGPRDLEDHIESGHSVWSPATEVPHCQQGLGTKLLPITGCQEVGPLCLPPSLAPASLSPLGQELLPSQIQSLHLLFSELGMKEGEASAALKPADGQIFIIFAQMGPGKPAKESSKSP